VEIFPTVVDIDRYSTAPSGGAEVDGGPPVVGWIGSPATVGYLRAVVEPLNRLSAAGRIRVRVVGAPAEALPELTAAFLPWSEADESRLVAGFDIGIMPLPDTPWERGKCAYKLIQCMACAKPVVASPVGANADVVRDGVDGLLAADPAAWTAALEALAADRDLRRRFGAAGRAAVERSYSLQSTAPRLAALLRRTAEQGGAGTRRRSSTPF
jgi:glycosyltransferase involved in cell wall biosynthesis